MTSRTRNRVAVVGPGRLGNSLAAGLARAGDRIVAVAGGSEDARAAFCARTSGTRPFASPSDAAALADLVIIATPAAVVADVVTRLVVEDAIGPDHRVIHLSGTLGVDALARAVLAGAQAAVCHPLVRVEAEESPVDVLLGASWAVTAGPADVGWATELVTCLGGDAHVVSDIGRVRFAAGVSAAVDGVGAAISAARRMLIAAGVPDPGSVLAPLVSHATANVLRDGASALGGPVPAADLTTLTSHLDAFREDAPELAEAYGVLATLVVDQVRSSLAPADAAAIEALLRHEMPSRGPSSRVPPGAG